MYREWDDMKIINVVWYVNVVGYFKCNSMMMRLARWAAMSTPVRSEACS